MNNDTNSPYLHKYGMVAISVYLQMWGLGRRIKIRICVNFYEYRDVIIFKWKDFTL